MKAVHRPLPSADEATAIQALNAAGGPVLLGDGIRTHGDDDRSAR